MPVQPTFPGVYIEEISSGVRTITGVPTSITAFVGRALRGPVNTPVVLNSFGDFERVFGGLWLKSSVSYAVRDYFLNGGGQAILVRLFKGDFFDIAGDRTAGFDELKKIIDAVTALPAPTGPQTVLDQVTPIVDQAVTNNPPSLSAFLSKAAEDSKAAVSRVNDKNAALGVLETLRRTGSQKLNRATLRVGSTNALALTASSPGAWGNRLRARVDHDVSKDAADRLGLKREDLFNLTVRDMATGVTEIIRNVTVSDSVRRVDKVLENESDLVRSAGTLPGSIPEASDDASGVKSTDPAFGDKRSQGVAPADAADDGKDLTSDELIGEGLEGKKEGLFALEHADIFNLLCVPPPTLDGTIGEDLLTRAMVYCEQRRAMMIVDPPGTWRNKDKAKEGFTKVSGPDIGTRSKNAAVFFPRIIQPNPLRENQLETFAPCGAVAGVIARTDAQRGVFKAPAGLDAALVGVPQLAVPLTDAENGELNPLGINCLRALPAAGRVVWGARTLQGDDRLTSEWKYLPVRRTALFIEESLYRGTQFAVFETNDEPLWAQIRLNVGAFMNNLFRQGAFQGRSPREAYLVKCDKETTTQNDINQGIVNVLVGFAPLKPAEFVIIKIQQLAGQISA